MPCKPLKPCKNQRCPKLTAGKYCEEHNILYKRESAKERGYDHKWKSIRKRYLIAFPLCVECLKQRPTEATEVHHIVPLRDGGTNDYSNLMALCKSCHSKYTAKDGGFGRNIVYHY